jgi:hypothetical protein
MIPQITTAWPSMDSWYLLVGSSVVRWWPNGYIDRKVST